MVYRRFDDWVLGEYAGTGSARVPGRSSTLAAGLAPIATGNPNVTAKVSRQVAAKYATHMIAKLADKCRRVGRNLTLRGRIHQAVR